MVVKYLPLVALVSSSYIAIAMAQEVGPPTPIDPAQLEKLLPKQGVASAGVGSNRPVLGVGGATLNALGNTVVGWNYFHATNCEYIASGGNNYIYVLPAEGGFWVTVNNTYTSSTFLTGCANGNWEGVHVIDTTTGAFDAIWVFTFK